MSIKPQNFEEKLVWYTIIGTYVLYFIGAQFVWVPVLAYFLALYLGKKIWNQTATIPLAERITIPVSVWVWIVAMLIMEIALIMAHINFELGLVKIIFTTVNSWARTWLLMALFPLIGCLNIRPKIIYRAACILCLQSLILTIICYSLYLLHIPSFAYLSPLQVFRGAADYYAVNLFISAEGGTQFRLQLFTNFANSLGLVGCVYFWLTTQESNKKWRWIGMIGAIAMVLGSGSRLTILGLAVVPVIVFFLTNFTWPVQVATSVVCLITGMVAPQIIKFIEDLYYSVIKGYRSSSERVRSQLKVVALERWSEAPIWGHGVVAEYGPKSTENMPIGSHEQWTDLLYVKGLVGFVTFLFAMLWSFSVLVIKAQKLASARAALGIYFAFLVATFGVDIENAAIYYWPGLVLTGIAFKEEVQLVAKTSKNYVLPELKSY